MRKLAVLFASLTLVLAACGGNQKEGDKPAEDNNNTMQNSEDNGMKEVVIEGNDQMQYNLDEITVKAGQKVKLTLKHVGEMPKKVMGHNWVLLQKGVDIPSFAQEAVAASIEDDHIPQARKDDIIAHTKLIGGGEETTITFQAPDKGTYDFMCSFPGHWGTMKGKFIVK